MTPVSFGGCFGWLHTPRAVPAGDVAALICQPVGYDALLSHCSLRVLADDLAAAGYPTLRFDYPGTGDACDEGVEAVGGHWKAWRKSVDEAADWLKQRTGARRLIVCGLRAGALFASLAASERADVAGLILLEPVLRGRSYLRQLFIEAQLRTGRPIPPGVGLVFREFRFTAATVSDLSACDLREVHLRPDQKVAIFAQGDTRPIAECAEAWTEHGTQVTGFDWEGLEPLLRHNILDENSLADCRRIVSWARENVPASPAPPPAASPPAPAELHPAGCIETPLLFGEGKRLFGMLCRPLPRPDRAPTDTLVIIANGGRDPHYGAARHAVYFARRLAQAGVASLRMDFAGLGDSLGPPGQENVLSSMFGLSRTGDFAAALDVLEGMGFHRFGAQGLCAGAFHSFHAALADPRLSMLLLINMPLFTMPEVGALDYLNFREMSPSSSLRKVFRPRSWISLYKRRKDLGPILRVQAARVHAQVTTRLRHLASALGIIDDPTFAESALAQLCGRSVRTLFLFSRDEGDIDAFKQEFGSPEKALRRYPGATWHIVRELDHDLTLFDGRAIAENVMINFVKAKDGAEPASRRIQANEALA
jgi:alpha-beta hydrolase superfamily lysophospholipase